MAANAVPFRSTIFYTTAGVPASAGSILTVGANGTQNFTSNLALNTLTASTISMQSTTIALGQSTNQTYTNFTNGSFSSTLMTSTLTSYNSLSTVTKVSMSQDGRLQYALQSVPSTLSYYQLARSADTGVTWNTLNTSTMGLPQGSLAYQSTVSGTPTYSNISQSATGQYALASVSGGQLYVSNNANSATPVYTPANVGGSPTIYLPFDALPITDMMGNTTITVTGSAPLVAGKVGTAAINLVNAMNGANATNYISGTWTGSANYTVSFWFRIPAYSSTQQTIFSGYGGANIIFINPTTNTLSIYIPSGGGLITTNYATTSFAISLNTWYNVVAIFQTGGLCSFYVNNTLINSTTNSGGLGTYTTTSFRFGTYDTSLSNSFSGYIDDFYLYNFAAPNVVNPFIYLPLDGNTTDAMGNSTVTPTGNPGYVFGAPVGTRTLSLANTAGGTAAQYVRGSWTYLNNFTVSLWVNFKSIASPNYQVIYSSHGVIIEFFVNPSNLLAAQLPTGTGTAYNVMYTTFPITINTWYQLTMIFQINGLCSFYVNNSLVGSFTNSGGYGTVTSSGLFSLGTYDNATTQAFNGYIDDLRIYNYAVTPSPIIPMNWSHTAVSGTGQYMMAACNSGGVFCSTNYGASWSQLTASQISSIVGTGNTAKTLMGPIIQPNSTVATAATWSVNGVTWTASSSTNNNSASFAAWVAFNGTAPTSGISPYSWASNAVYSGSGSYTGSVSTSITGQTAQLGEWIQIQSSVPLVMYSYSYGCGSRLGIAKTHFIVGSNDGSTWYPIQSAVMSTNPLATDFTVCTSYLIVNQSGSQTINGVSPNTGTGTFTTYPPYTTTAYTYFRLIVTSTFNAGNAEYTELYINFSTPMPLLTASAPNTSAVTVSPQMMNLAAANWSTPNGVTWTVSASTTISTFFPYKAFDNTLNSSWNNTSQTYTPTTNTSGVNTTASGVAGQITGDYIQLQSSVPLVINSYQLATGGGPLQIPSTFYIVGSNDNSTWFAIQKCVAASTGSAPAALNNLIPGIITVATSGSQTFGNTSLTTTTYSTTTNAYTYFRIIGTATFGTGPTYLEIGEWFINFTAYTPNPVNALAITNGGQNMLVAATGTTMPNSTTTSNSWTANGVTWTASQSSAANSNTYLGYLAFNHALTAPDWACGNAIALYTSATPGVPNANTAVVSNVTGLQSGTTITGEWLEIQSSVPLIMYSYMSASGGTAIYAPRTYNIIGSNDRTNWFNLHSASHSTNPTTSTFSTYTPYIFVNYSGSQTVTGQATSTVTTATTSYATNAYTYFRLVVTSIFTGNIAEIGEWFINFQAGATYLSTNYGSTWSTVCTAPPTAPSLATSGNGQYILTGSGQLATLYSNGALTTYTIPTLTGINANINCASISSTGQNMIILTQGTTNNVFYSTNYGVTFTGMTVGTLPMTSCAISADGNEIMVSNAANVWVLNRNTQGFSITMGNQSGLINQGQNSIAIGNLAGVTNQSANSIILNASGAVQDAYNPGFFVSPILPQATSTQTSVNLLGYGGDNQVVYTGLSMRADGTFNPFNVNNTGNVSFAGNVGFGTTVPTAPLHIYAPASTVWPFALVYSSGPQLVIGNNGTSNIALDTYNSVTGTRPALCLNPSGGYVGIGVTNPSSALHMNGKSGGGHWNNSCLLLSNGFSSTIDQITNGTSLQLSNGANSIYFNIMTYGYTGGSSLYIANGTPSGVVLTSGAQVWGAYSDSRMKINITPLPSELTKLLQLNPITYLFEKDPIDHPHIPFRIGFLADQIREIYPNLVSTDTSPPYTNLNGDTFRPLVFTVTDLIPYLTKGIQELAKQATSSAAQIQELSEKATSQASLVQELASQTAQLSAENTELKSAISAQASAISAQASAIALLEARLAALESK